jgi:hypothetical protein
MHWHDLELPGAGSDAMAPLVLTVRAGGVRAGVPPFRVELASGRRARVVRGETTVLWFRGRRWYQGHWCLTASVPRETEVAVVPPITAAEVRAVDEPAGSAAWLRAWARWFARALIASPCTPLHAGEWQLVQLVPSGVDHLGMGKRADRARLDVAPLRDTLARPALEYRSYSRPDLLVATRAFSPPDAARVKAWRKHARDGTLPPLLALGIAGLAPTVLLDGHDRLVAAQLEGRTPAMLALWYTYDARRPASYLASNAEEREDLARTESFAALWGPTTTEQMNARYVWAYEGETYRDVRTRAFPIPGGRAQWDREVGARLDALGPGVDRAMLRDDG